MSQGERWHKLGCCVGAWAGVSVSMKRRCSVATLRVAQAKSSVDRRAIVLVSEPLLKIHRLGATVGGVVVLIEGRRGVAPLLECTGR